MKKIGKKAILILAAVIIAAVYYYVTIPAINIHSSGFWVFIAIAAVVLLVLYAAPRVRTQKK